MDNIENLPMSIQQLWKDSNTHFLNHIKHIQEYDKTLQNNNAREETILVLFKMKAQFNRCNNNNIDNDEIIFLAVSLFDSYIMQNDLKISIPLFMRAIWYAALYKLRIDFTHTGLIQRFNDEEIKNAQFELAFGLQYNFNIPHTFRILKEFSEYLSVERGAYLLAEFLLIMILFHTKSLYHKNIYLTLAALHCACQLFDIVNYQNLKKLLNDDQRNEVMNAVEMINYCLRHPLPCCIDIIHKYGTAEYLFTSKICYDF